MTAKLTARQQQVLDIIRSEIERTGFPPTRAEIAQVLGFKSANAAEDHLKALARKGAIELTAGTGLATNNVDWARIDVTATTPPAPRGRPASRRSWSARGHRRSAARAATCAR